MGLGFRVTGLGLAFWGLGLEFGVWTLEAKVQDTIRSGHLKTAFNSNQARSIKPLIPKS